MVSALPRALPRAAPGEREALHEAFVTNKLAVQGKGVAQSAQGGGDGAGLVRRQAGELGGRGAAELDGGGLSSQ
jgi:hypothetical protein